MCNESRARGHRFCRWCGSELEAPISEPETGKAAFFCGICIMIVCIAILVMELIVAFYQSPYVFENLHDYRNGMLIITPVPVVLFYISGGALQAYYIALLAAVLISVLILVYKVLEAVEKQVKEKDTEAVKESALFEMSVLFAATYVIQMAFILIIMAMGIDVESPIISEGDGHWEEMFLLLEASVWEEIVSRVLLIGVPMLAIAAVLRHRNVRSELDPDTKLWRYLTGGFGITRIAVVFIFFSAIMFGIAHVPGWDLWKFFPTFMVGLVMGYLFVKHGLFAAIGIHFLTDYLSALDWIMTDGSFIMVMPLLLLILLGIPYVLIYLKRGLAYMKGAFVPQKAQ